ncbi:MAG: HAD family hydrolase [Lachnospiraceae bacterium]|nr:HAD family hydrolase [Lachnospiraceae bacterium]
MKTKKPIIAIMYDFDKTLCTKDMQEYTFIPSLDESAESFWEKTDRMAKEEKMDPVLTYMYLMIRLSKDKHKRITRDAFEEAGKDIKLFPGVETWFDRINKFGEENGVIVEHYIISSGLKEIIEGNRIAKCFKEIFACEFHYDENGAADWPKLGVNFTGKTQFLFRINKGLLNLGDNSKLNRYVPEPDRRVPFRNMIYIGDGMTDVPCMKLVNLYGGKSIAVYQGNHKETARELIKDNRINFAVKANYEEGKELDSLIKKIIIKMAAEDVLIDYSRKQRNL